MQSEDQTLNMKGKNFFRKKEFFYQQHFKSSKKLQRTVSELQSVLDNKKRVERGGPVAFFRL